MDKKKDLGLNLKDQKEDLTSEDNKIQEKTKRTPEQIKEMFLENYTDEDGYLDVDKMVKREQATGKVVSTLIGQKNHFKKYDSRKDPKPKEGEDPKPKTPEEADTQKEPLEKIKAPKRKLAAEDFLTKFKKKYPDKNAKEVYDKMQEVYEEDGTEITEKDFTAKIGKAFQTAYPDLAENEIRVDERKKLKEKMPNLDIDSLSKTPIDGKKEKKTLIKSKSTPINDWYKE